MLLTLSVQNFAIIDNIHIDFHEGMTVLTGETGAGKSIIIDAIGLLFGKRADNEMIRYGENKATIEGVFTNYSPEIIEILVNLGIECDNEDNLVIKRELYSSGKSACRINNTVVTLSQLQELSQYIGDIHSQNDTQGLINPKNYLRFINDINVNNSLDEYTQILKIYRNYSKDYKNMLAKANESKEKEEFLKFQKNEFESANLSVAEEENLKENLQILDNYENIITNLKAFNNIYDEDEVLTKIYESLTYLSKLANYDNKYVSLKENLENIYYTLEELINSNEFKLSKLEFDEAQLNAINERLAVYSDFKRKYKKTTQELSEYSKSITDELKMIENYDFYLNELKNKVEDSYNKLLKTAKTIREQRIVIAKKLENDIKKHLTELQLKDVCFEVKFNELDINNINFKNDGIDEVDFLVSFNKGEPVKPLSKIASGGEMSRFMLALKTVLGNLLPLQTKIFDEIDNGVSGAVAYSIAQKIKLISKSSQVLCITHLPQVASICNHHLKISKSVINGRTITKIEELNYDAKVLEIAGMISKGQPTQASIALAKELLSTNTNF